MSKQWVSVKDDLPKRGQTVIAWAANGKDQTPDLMQEAHFNGRDFVYGFHRNWMRGVTHWMPFPEPPTED